MYFHTVHKAQERGSDQQNLNRASISIHTSPTGEEPRYDQLVHRVAMNFTFSGARFQDIQAAIVQFMDQIHAMKK